VKINLFSEIEQSLLDFFIAASIFDVPLARGDYFQRFITLFEKFDLVGDWPNFASKVTALLE
jgi:hypothetical protein